MKKQFTPRILCGFGRLEREAEARKEREKNHLSQLFGNNLENTINDGATQMQPVYSCPVPSNKIGERVWALWRRGADPVPQSFLGEGAAG